MALPAGRRGIRADLVKSDGTISDLTKLKEDFAALSASDIPTINVPLFKSLIGNPVTISDAVGENAKCAKATLEPIQDLHGYDHPWAGGAGKNLLPMTVDGIKAYNTGAWSGNVYTYNGCTYEILTDDANNVIGIKVNGTSTANAVFWLGMVDYVANTNMSINSGVQTGTDNVFFRMSGWGKNTYTVSAISSGDNKSFSFDTNGELWGNLRIGAGEQVTNMIFRPYLFLDSNPMTSFEPYSNICPITGRTQVEISNKDSEDVEQASVTVDLGQTVYGGTLNVTTGELTVKTANIASYNGESIGEPWWSSLDEYVPGTSPTTGAQVVYTLATPQTIQLTPAQIQLLTTTNIISTNADALSILYCATEEGNVEGALQYLFDKIEELSA